jgi:hypothetical protein
VQELSLERIERSVRYPSARWFSGRRRRGRRWGVEGWCRGGPHGQGRQLASASVLGVFSGRKLLETRLARRSDMVHPGGDLHWLVGSAAAQRRVAGKEQWWAVVLRRDRGEVRR